MDAKVESCIRACILGFFEFWEEYVWHVVSDVAYLSAVLLQLL